MPIATSPFTLSDVSLTLKVAGGAAVATEYMCQLNRAELVPAAASTGSEFETFCDTFAAPPKAASWTLELTGFQAWADATDLSLFLFDNELKESDFILAPVLNAENPISATNPGFQGKVVLTPGSIGGTANQYAQMTVSLVVKGKPTKITTPPVALAVDEDQADVELDETEVVEAETVAA